MNRARLALGIFLVLLVSGCGGMLEQCQVRNDFLHDHPNYSIVSIGDPDGNESTVVTFFIVYKKPNDEREYWSDWAYDQNNGKFELVGKGSENIHTN